jgi:hypothetical protein
MKTINIAAAINGQPGVYTEQMAQAGFSIVSTTAAFDVQIGNQTKRTVAQAQNVGNGDGPDLGRVTFFNSSASAITVQIGDWGDARATAIAANAATFVGGNSQLYKLGGTGIAAKVLPGLDANGLARKVIYVSNSGRVDIGGATTTRVVSVAAYPPGGTMVIVQPGTTEPIETSADLEIFPLDADLSAATGSVQVAVLEIFYSKSLQTDQ